MRFARRYPNVAGVLLLFLFVLMLGYIRSCAAANGPPQSNIASAVIVI